MKTPVILAIDTSTDRITIALSKGSQILVNETYPSEHNHSKKLLRLIDDCLKKENLKLDDIDAFSVVVGPGSFTGVRTGLGTAKSFAFSLKKPLIGISSLYAMTYPCLEYEIVMPVIEAKKDFLYSALFQKKDGKWFEKNPPTMVPVQNLQSITSEPAIVIGSAIKKYMPLFPNLLSSSMKTGNSKFDYICGTTLCDISYQKFLNNEFEDVFSLEPLYIQKTAAEGYV